MAEEQVLADLTPEHPDPEQETTTGQGDPKVDAQGMPTDRPHPLWGGPGRPADQPGGLLEHADPVAAGDPPAPVGFRPASQADLVDRAAPATRVAQNLAALRLLRDLDVQARPATPAEQQVLARWGSWGAVPQVFDQTRPEQLRELLSPAEYRAAERTTINAHYTHHGRPCGRPWPTST